MTLADLQRALVANLTSPRAALPPGCDPGQLARARRSLIMKRAHAAAHLLPALALACGDRWFDHFTDHGYSYAPAGMLYHVDDAWAFALAMARDPERRVARAACDDLANLKRFWTRDQRRSADRVRERRHPLDALRRWLLSKIPS